MSMTEYESPDGGIPLQKPGMGTAAKVLIVLAVVFGGLILLCCGGVYFTGMQVRDMVSEDPAIIAQTTEEITTIRVPDGLEPVMSMDMKIPFTDQPVMVTVVYADEQTDSTLTLVAFGETLGEQNQAQMRSSIDQSLNQQKINREDVVVFESYPKEVEIRGEQAQFTINKGTGRQSNTQRIQVMGVFQGKTGQVMLMLNVDAEKFSEEEVIAMIESIE